MSKSLLLFLVLFSTNSWAQWSQELRLGVPISWQHNFIDRSTGTSYPLGEKLFGGVGFGLGYSFKYKWENLVFKWTLDLDYKEESMKAVLSNLSETDFQFGIQRSYSGLQMEYLLIDAWGIVFEYLYSVSGKIQNIVGSASSPFAEGDILTGTASSAGFSFHWEASSSVLFFYRKLSYNKWEHSGSELLLPNTNYSDLISEEVSVQLVFGF